MFKSVITYEWKNAQACECKTLVSVEMSEYVGVRLSVIMFESKCENSKYV